MFPVTTKVLPQTSFSSKSPSTQLPRVTARLHAPSTLSDRQLLSLCTQYGTQAKLWKQKFLGLLPEVDQRKLYLQAGCTSIVEFAAKLGGISKEQVQRVLQLHQRFETTPKLKQALVLGEVTVHKLARVASIATPENQEFLLNQTQLLSSRALETLVKDAVHSNSVHVHTKKPNKKEKIEQFDDLGLSPDIRNRLLSLRNKGIDINQLLGEFLNQREENIQQKKQRMAEEDNKARINASTPYLKKEDNVKSSRYIPQTVKQLLKQEYGEKCAQETCTNRATNIHHTRRFSLNPSHNPLFLAPLCHQHHEIAHAVDVKTTQRRRSIRRF